MKLREHSQSAVMGSLVILNQVILGSVPEWMSHITKMFGEHTHHDNVHHWSTVSRRLWVRCWWTIQWDYRYPAWLCVDCWGRKVYYIPFLPQTV